MSASTAEPVAAVPAPSRPLLAEPAAPALPADAMIGVVDDPDELARYTRWIVGADGERLGESALQLAGLHCAACSGVIERALAGVPGVVAAQVGAAAERATVTWDPRATRASALIVAVRRAGYDAVPDAAAPARALRRQAHRQLLWRLFVAAFCSMQVMMMATPSYVAGPGELAPDLRQLLNWGSWVLSLPVLVFSSGPFLRGAWRSLRARRVGMDVPVALGIAITFVASTGATFDPGGVFGSDVYFDSMTMFVAFLLGARYVELRARHSAAETIEAALAKMPETAWRVAADGGVEAVAAHRLCAGDVVRVAVGEAFPADGELVAGTTRADEALLSGESTPVDKAAGSELVGGSVNVGAPVEMRVQRVGADTRFETIVSMMRNATTQRPAAARVADRWAAPFLWTVLLLAAAAAAAWSVVDPTRAVWVAVAVLIVTCPCALSLAAPATLVAAARGAARDGVLLRRLDAIEALAGVDRAFVDKTGTLTEDRMQWRATVRTPRGRDAFGDDAAALGAAASLAAWSRHPLSRAIADAAPAAAAAATTRWRDVAEHAGRGVEARDVDGRTWRLGAPGWAASGDSCAGAGDAPAARDAGDAGDAGEAGAARNAADSRATGDQREGVAAGRVVLTRDGVALAVFAIDEALRPDAADAVRALRADGVAVTLLTGDRADRAAALDRRVGFDAVVAAATPEDKLQAVAAAQRAGERVLMVGDGVNDAPVLARADVSLAMAQGALVSRSQADAVITSQRLADVVRARRRARRALAIVRQNFVWAGGYNLVAIPLALAGWLPPWAAGIGMAASSLVVVLNALRAARPLAD